MSIEAQLTALLGPLVNGRCYPDTAPEVATFPLIIYQQVGGVAAEYLDQTPTDKDNARMQVVVWSRTRLEASAIARAARLAILGSNLIAKTLGAPISLHQEQLNIYGTRTDFSLWFTP